MAYNLVPGQMIVAALLGALLGGCASFAPKEDTAISQASFENDKSACWAANMFINHKK